MKTSFYFVLWIIIYPLLDLLNVEFINDHSFIIAIVIVFSLSAIINKILGDTIFYDESITTAPILEDVFTGNVDSFKKRLKHDATLETIFSVYFVLNIFVALYIITLGTSSVLELIIFGGLAYASISRVISFRKGVNLLNFEPTPERCLEIVEDTYRLNYTSYYNNRINGSYEDALPPQPHGYQFYKIISAIFSIIAICLGAAFSVLGIFFLLSVEYDGSIILGLIWLLYGSLAIYYGIKDTKELVRSTKNRTYIAIGAVVAIIVAIACFIPSRHSQEIAALKRELTHANAQCPIPLMDIGQIYSIGFDDKNNYIVYNVEVTDDFYFNFITDNWAYIYNALKSDDKQFIKKICDINIGIRYRYEYNNQSKEITLSANDINNILNNPIPDEDLLNQLVEADKSTIPVAVDEGTTFVDAIIEDNKVIYICEIDEGIYDIDEFIAFLTENEESLKQDIMNNLTINQSAALFKRTNTSIVYRYIGNSSQKYIDITITPDEM